jgi:hypothetical protein
MADSYPEDITSEAEEEMAGLTTEEVTEKEVDGGAEEEKQNDGAKAEEEQIPQNLHGYWAKFHVKDAHVQALENEGTVAPRQSPTGGLTSKPWCQPLTPPIS